MHKINLDEKFGLFDEHWRPKIIATVNGQDVKVIKVKGDFVRHHYDTEDECFIVWKGRFIVEFRDRVVEQGPGECVVVPKGTEHRTCADEEALVLCFEPAGVLNTATAGASILLRNWNGSRFQKRRREYLVVVLIGRQAYKIGGENE
jgi:mannose-6-phosphate isomerase-like protein (cupin superfamily)